jgi:hypothetical protein
MKFKLLLTLLIPIITIGQLKLKQKFTVIEKKIEFSVPFSLKEMNDKDFTIKYQKLIKPLLVLSDVNGEINLIIDSTTQRATEKQLKGYKEFRIANLKKTRTDFVILEDSIKIINGKSIGYIKFRSNTIDQSIFNYYFFFILDGKIVFCTFNCIEKLKKTWEPTADAIINSFVIK